MSKTKSGSGVTPGQVVWQRDLNLEALLDSLGVEWEYRENVPISSIKIDPKNPTRLFEELNREQVLAIAHKIVTYGLALNGLCCRDEDMRCLGGNHRTAGCREAGIKTCNVYVVKGTGPATEYIIGVGDNNGGRPLSPDEVMHHAVTYSINNPGEDAATVAKYFKVKEARLREKIRIHQFRATMSQPATLVQNRDSLSDRVVSRLYAAKSRVTDPILYQMANTLARYKKVTENQARDLIEAVTKAEPKTDANMSAVLLAEEAKLALSQARTTPGGKKAPSTPGERVMIECRRVLGAGEVFDKRDPRDLYPSSDMREEFVGLAKSIISRLQKVLKALKEES